MKHRKAWELHWSQKAVGLIALVFLLVTEFKREV